MDIYEKSLRISAKAHKEQVRKSDGVPYISHPVMVARIVEQNGFAIEAVCAALVHDVLEDTSVTEDELRGELGDAIVDIVTAVSENTDLEWEIRKEKYIEEVVASGELVWAVSVADKIHNAQSLINFHNQVGKEAWSSFNRGKDKKVWFEKTLLEELQKVWQHPMLDNYAELVARLEKLEA